jgi:predicted HicB family RNase H-like nuclease
MPVSEAQKKSAAKWDAKNLDRLSLALPAGSRDAIKAHAAQRGESVNAFIGRAIREQMRRDNAAGED